MSHKKSTVEGHRRGFGIGENPEWIFRVDVANNGGDQSSTWLFLCCINISLILDHFIQLLDHFIQPLNNGIIHVVPFRDLPLYT